MGEALVLKTHPAHTDAQRRGRRRFNVGGVLVSNTSPAHTDALRKWRRRFNVVGVLLLHNPPCLVPAQAALQEVALRVHAQQSAAAATHRPRRQLALIPALHAADRPSASCLAADLAAVARQLGSGRYDKVRQTS